MQVLEYKHSRGITQVIRCEQGDIEKKLKNFKFIICDDYFKNEIRADYYFHACEQSKTLNSVQSICESLLNAQVSRTDEVLIIGGGVTADTAGFACSLYLRGVSWSYLPTTLLSQVDSCLGGKVGVNTSHGKNLIGQFYHPRSIYLSRHFLQTLPTRELLSGWGEIYKYAELEEKNADVSKLVEGFPDIPKDKIIEKCLKIKSNYVVEDEFDLQGQRVLLNSGHTLGHAIEATLDFQISHGESVWWGLLFERFLVEGTLSSCGALFSYTPQMKKEVLKLNAHQLLEFIKHDKKGAMTFIVSALPKQLKADDFEQTWNIFRAKFKAYEDDINWN